MVGMPTDRKERNVEAIAENGEKWGQEEGKRKKKKEQRQKSWPGKATDSRSDRDEVQ